MSNVASYTIMRKKLRVLAIYSITVKGGATCESTLFDCRRNTRTAANCHC
ncbi:protein of unknown function [Paenibacillus alvei]|uniref:Uncharacterized protein n=1 Tax=Paenibacillus alvei TaxID=44250 RepID=A0A383RCW2_PAEAL|nr:protein of unknown function [Paenibacillus alvei]